MKKIVLLTGATDGIGLETSRRLVSLGHHALLHGRNRTKLDRVEQELSALPGSGEVESVAADLSVLAEAEALASAVSDRHASIDVLINNAGVYVAPETRTDDGLDVRFAVNTIAPYILTRRLLPLLGESGRVVNVSSAAQSAVDLAALAGDVKLADGAAYAQSKLALIMWTRSLARTLEGRGPTVIAVNPGSLLGTKMVREAFGRTGADVGIGADALRRAALADEFDRPGEYFDNDSGRFAAPHPDALDPRKCQMVVDEIEKVLERTPTR